MVGTDWYGGVLRPQGGVGDECLTDLLTTVLPVLTMSRVSWWLPMRLGHACQCERPVICLAR